MAIDPRHFVGGMGSPSSAATASELAGDNVEIADVGCRGEELVGFLREGLSNGPAKMRLTSRLVRERVENAERRRAEPNREPWFRAGFLLDERQCRKEKFLDCIFFAGLGLEPYQQCLGSHVDLPFLWWMTGRAQNLAAAAECPLASRYSLCPLTGGRSVVPTDQTFLRGVDLRAR